MSAVDAVYVLGVAAGAAALVLTVLDTRRGVIGQGFLMAVLISVLSVVLAAASDPGGLGGTG